MPTTNESFAFCKREDDHEFFICAIADLGEKLIKHALKCKDHNKPETKEEANALAILYQYCDEAVPVGVFQKLKGKLPTNPTRRRFYSSTPVCEKKTDVIAFASARDGHRGEAGFPPTLGGKSTHRAYVGYCDEISLTVAGAVPAVPSLTELEDQVKALKEDLEEMTERAVAAEALSAHRLRMIVDYRNLMHSVTGGRLVLRADADQPQGVGGGAGDDASSVVDDRRGAGAQANNNGNRGGRGRNANVPPPVVDLGPALDAWADNMQGPNDADRGRVRARDEPNQAGRNVRPRAEASVGEGGDSGEEDGEPVEGGEGSGEEDGEAGENVSDSSSGL